MGKLHVLLWKEWWYALTSKISLLANFYMTWKYQAFITNVVVNDLPQKTMAANIISWPIGAQFWNLMSLLKSTSIESFMRGTTLFRWPWRCTTYASMIWIVSSKNVLVFSMIDNQKIICLFAFNFSSSMLLLFFVHCVMVLANNFY